MKRSELLLVILLFTASWSCSDRSTDITNPPPQRGFTELKGSLNGALQADQSPYQVVDTIFVDSAQTLTIPRGVKLYFTDSAMFVIYGKLEAVGDSNLFISFTAYHNNWKGIRVVDSDQSSLFRFCLIEKVYTDWRDSSQFGALEINNSTATVQNCIFRGNSSIQGGGLSLLGDSSVVTNNIFRENEAVAFGGAILAYESKSRIINNTFYNNFCTNVGGGLVLYYPLSVDIQNNIFFENTGSYPWIYFYTGDSSGFNQQYNFLAMGNQNPQFVSNANLHLRDYSPCIDAGNPAPAYDDADGTRNDQGAYGGPRGEW